MKSLPTELLYILVFVAIVLLNFAMQRIARRGQPQGAPDAATADQDDADDIDDEVWQPPPPVAAPRRVLPDAQSGSGPGMLGASARPRRRFSRQRLFGSPQAMRDAVVIATVWGPCRADQPHDPS